MSKTGRRKYFLSLALESRVEPLGKSKNALRLSCNTKIRQRRKALSKPGNLRFSREAIFGFASIMLSRQMFF